MEDALIAQLTKWIIEQSDIVQNKLGAYTAATTMEFMDMPISVRYVRQRDYYHWGRRPSYRAPNISIKCGQIEVAMRITLAVTRPKTFQVKVVALIKELLSRTYAAAGIPAEWAEVASV